MSLDLQTRADGVVLKIRAVAGASRDRVVGLHGGALKLATTAAPEKGKANVRLLSLLAGSLGLFVFGELHVMTLVFGSTLIGVCIDYPIHFFNHHALDAESNIKMFDGKP